MAIKLSVAAKLHMIQELVNPKDDDGNPLPPLITPEQARKLMQADIDRLDKAQAKRERKAAILRKRHGGV